MGAKGNKASTYLVKTIKISASKDHNKPSWLKSIERTNWKTINLYPSEKINKNS